MLSNGCYLCQGVDELPAFCNGDQYHTPIPEQSLDGGGTLENDLVDSQLVNKRFAILPPHSNYKDSNGPPEVKILSYVIGLNCQHVNIFKLVQFYTLTIILIFLP